MAQSCYNCGKTSMHGNLVSHAKNHTLRTFHPNLHPLWVTERGKKKRVKFCAKCMRRYKQKESKVAHAAVQAKVPQVSNTPVSQA